MKIFFCLLFLLSSLDSFAKPKIGVVDIEKIFADYHNKLEIEKDIQTRIEALKTSPRVLAVQETDTKLKELAATVRDKKLAPETRELAGKEFNSIAMEHQSLVQEMEQFLSSEKNQATRELVEALEKVIAIVREEISAVAQEEGCDLVLETGGATSSQISPIIYLREKTDLTALVLSKRLNKDAPAEAQPSKRKPNSRSLYKRPPPNSLEPGGVVVVTLGPALADES